MRAASVWRHRDLRIVAPARALSFLGDQLALVALTLHAYDAGWGARGVAAVLVAGGAPLALAAPFGGRLVDRVDSRRTTIGAALWQSLAALLLVAVLRADITGPAGVILVLSFVALIGVGQAVAGPAWQALVPHVVPQDEIGRAVSVLQSTSMLVAVTGPALGGLLVAAGGPAGALAVDAATFAVLAIAARFLRTVRRPGPEAPGAPRGLRAGFDFLRSDPLLWALVVGLIVVMLLAQVMDVVLVLVVRGALGAGPTGYGVVNAAMAAGMVGGSIAAGRVPTGPGQARAAAWGAALVTGLVAAVGIAPSLVWVGTAMAGVGLANGVLSVSAQAFILGRTPDEIRGRVMSTVVGGVQTATVLGMGLGAVLGEAVEARQAIVASGLVGFAAGLWVVTIVVRRGRGAS